MLRERIQRDQDKDDEHRNLIIPQNMLKRTFRVTVKERPRYLYFFVPFG